MKDNYKVLGDYIEMIDERNKDLSIKNLLCVSISKRFIPSIANIIGTDLSSYKIVRTGQFAYGPVTSRNGEKVSIAFLNEDDCIISSSYSVFKVTDTKKLDPQYLMLWFSRPEFDRYARYKSHGSVREIFDWDELCQVELPVPHIDKQKDIVKAYNIISDRIELKRKINDNLFASVNAFFTEKFSPFLHEDMRNMPNYVQLKNFIKVKHGYAFDGEQFSENATSKVLVSPGNFKIGGGFQSNKPKYYNEDADYNTDYVLKAGSLVVTMTDLSKNGDTLGFPAIIPEDDQLTFLHNQRVGLVEFIGTTYPKAFIYFLMCSSDYRNYILATASGTTVRHTSPDKISGYGFITPNNKDDLVTLNRLYEAYLTDSDTLNLEIKRLSELQALLLSKMIN